MNKKQRKATQSLVEASALSAVDLFAGLPAKVLRAIQSKSSLREFAAGHVFFQPGESGDVLFLLEKGRVQTFRKSRSKKLIIAELRPPAIFGEMGCIGQGMYYCSAETIEPSRIRTISRRDLGALLEKYPIITNRLLELVSQRFLHVLQDLESRSFRQLIPRLAALLLEKQQDGALRGWAQKEIAEHLGVYRESASVALGELRSAGIITVERKQIRILDRHRLERAARE
jgi:CRP-like cAMP-binding protein